MPNDARMKLRVIYDEVVARNPGEAEFHQAVQEVLECLGPVLARYPEFGRNRIIRYTTFHVHAAYGPMQADSRHGDVARLLLRQDSATGE